MLKLKLNIGWKFSEGDEKKDPRVEPAEGTAGVGTAVHSSSQVQVWERVLLELTTVPL